jgi:putative ABC transport system permease protein
MGMSVENLSRVAIRALERNKMRTGLTCLGILIGVAAVIALTGVSNSLKVAVREKIQSFGTTSIMMMSVKKPFNESDLKDIKRLVPEIQYVTPMNSWEFPVKYKNKNMTQKVYAVGNEYFSMGNWDFETGGPFTPEEINSNEKVVIIGSSIKKHFFEGEDPTGKVILINRLPFRIVGCLLEKGMSLGGADFDNFIAGPYTTMASKVFGTNAFFIINVSAYSEDQVEAAKKNLLDMLQKKYSLSTEQLQHYKVNTFKEAIEKTEEISGLLSAAMIVIALISLVVGGIGIMNIMLASVSERTHEIGIRMAIGAKTSDILRQFLIEAIIVSSMGGIAGIVIGVVFYIAYTLITKQLFLLSLTSVFISFFFSAMVGVVFGYYPAKKASRLNPIDALRYE